MVNRTMLTLVTGTVLALAPLATSVSPAAAHPHTAENASHRQLLANGQNHAAFDPRTFTSCYVMTVGGVTTTSDPAVYGLETAHHGPDAGTPGKRADGCYTNDKPVSQDDVNPGIG